MTISDERINDIANCVAGKINGVITELRRFFLIDNMVDSVKFGLSLWLLTYIGSWFNAMTLLILGALTGCSRYYPGTEDHIRLEWKETLCRAGAQDFTA